jgi:hypothetical protein
LAIQKRPKRWDLAHEKRHVAHETWDFTQEIYRNMWFNGEFNDDLYNGDLPIRW